MWPRQSNSYSRSFKQRKSLASRMREAAEIRAKYPTKIPVVVERYQKEKQLPWLDRTKFLASQDSSMSQFMITLRSLTPLQEIGSPPGVPACCSHQGTDTTLISAVSTPMMLLRPICPFARLMLLFTWDINVPSLSLPGDLAGPTSKYTFHCQDKLG
ncbi:uncharacterized protein LOC102946118 isoform X1 [Chelonia mydas]|uniref:uncharacterized protein LOC102946118 isoform X1 n=1 Tax=Chelonia mydas TaxID=8469 RepID=UPI001CA82D3C|nr:uncharacterized protein LOC102946118 isoform X1 [Chelonia mydas]